MSRATVVDPWDGLGIGALGGLGGTRSAANGLHPGSGGSRGKGKVKGHYCGR